MNEVVSFIPANPVTVLTDAKQYSEFYSRIKAEVSSHVPDVSTAGGRKAISSLAFKVTRTKTAIDDAGKALNEEARARINVVDAQRRKIREELAALADEVRKPLTVWEEAEEQRKEDAASDLRKIADNSVVLASDTAATIKARWTALNTMILRDDVHLDGIEHARKSLDAALDVLEQARERAQKHEDDQRELAKLRAEQDERDRLDRESRAKAEADRIEKERAERDAAEQAARLEAAAQRARDEEQRKARAAIEAAEREKQAAVAKAEAEARAVREKAEREEADRLAKIEAERREQAARDADREHRSSVMKAAKEAMMTQGAGADTAKKIVLAIIANEIPHVSLRF